MMCVIWHFYPIPHPMLLLIHTPLGACTFPSIHFPNTHNQSLRLNPFNQSISRTRRYVVVLVKDHPMWCARWLVWNLVQQFMVLVLSPKNITVSFCRTTTSSYAKERYAVVGEWGWLRIWAALQLLLKIWPVNKTENLGGKRENRWAQFSSLRAFPFSTGFSQYLLYTYLIFCRWVFLGKLIILSILSFFGKTLLVHSLQTWTSFSG